MKKLHTHGGLWNVFLAYSFVLFLLSAAGCNGPALSSAEQLAEFNRAGPIIPEVDIDSLIKAKIHTGAYRPVAGDILELQMPAVLRLVHASSSDSPQKTEPYLCRLSDDGSINLPIVGPMFVAGKSLAEVEASIVQAYFPRYVVTAPAVVCEVAQYHTENVTVLGAVEQPGVYALQSDEMSLVGLIMKAGGIVEDGASSITIRRPQQDRDPQRSGRPQQAEQSNLVALASEPNTVCGPDAEDCEPIVLPVKGLNIPFADVTLRGGDVVEVERLNRQVFTVIGLIREPGVFPYPQGVRYNLTEALGFAGGVNLLVDPHYATIYRQDADGQIISAIFGIDSKSLARASNVIIKPGDIISVEPTARTRANLILAEMFYIRAGVDFRAPVGSRW